jgi:hypothetical protein
MEVTQADRITFVAGVCAFAVWKDGQRVVSITGTPTAVIRKGAMAGDYDTEIIAEKRLQGALEDYEVARQKMRASRTSEKSTTPTKKWENVTAEEFASTMARHKGNRIRVGKALGIRVNRIKDLLEKYNMQDLYPNQRQHTTSETIAKEAHAAAIL